jgi:hypothetical protein
MTKSKQLNRAYILVPLVFLAIFSYFYVQFDRGFEAKQAEIRANEKAARIAQIEKENESRRAAVEQAKLDGERMRAKKAARDKLDQEHKDAIQAAFQARDKAQIDDANQKDHVETLKRGVANAENEIKHLKTDITELEQQKAAVETVEQTAEANAQQYQQLLDQIDAADKAAAKAAADAAAAKKKSSS